MKRSLSIVTCVPPPAARGPAVVDMLFSLPSGASSRAATLHAWTASLATGMRTTRSTQNPRGATACAARVREASAQRSVRSLARRRPRSAVGRRPGAFKKSNPRPAASVGGEDPGRSLGRTEHWVMALRGRMTARGCCMRVTDSFPGGQGARSGDRGSLLLVQRVRHEPENLAQLRGWVLARERAAEVVFSAAQRPRVLEVYRLQRVGAQLEQTEDRRRDLGRLDRAARDPGTPTPGACVDQRDAGVLRITVLGDPALGACVDRDPAARSRPSAASSARRRSRRTGSRSTRRRAAAVASSSRGSRSCRCSSPVRRVRASRSSSSATRAVPGGTSTLRL
jgi:hypothetical protein